MEKGRAERKGGLFAVVCAEKGGGGILTMGEMPDAECNEYKERSIQRVNAIARVGTYYHDCARRAAHAFEGVYCDRCFLDTFHSRRHKCSRESFDPSHHASAAHVKEGGNSQFAEQLWSEMGPMKCAELPRPRYRCLVGISVSGRTASMAMFSV